MHLSVRALRISGCVLGHSRVVTRVARASRLAGRSSDCSQDRTSLTCARSMASMAPTPTACAPAWTALATTSTDLTLRFTLPTGQSFRWWQTGISEYTGVLGSRVVQMRQDGNDVRWRVVGRGDGVSADQDAEAIADYFNLHIDLTKKAEAWAAADKRYGLIAPFIHGCRLLRQPPLECTFQFICSSNNHISRIHGMVEHLCKQFGTRLHILDESVLCAMEGKEIRTEYWAFPTIEQLQAATESGLREAGFGYRAKYIVGAAALLAAHPAGGEEWLLSLRSRPYNEVLAELTQLPGVGPKVAACVALFSCDQHSAIPVDTHVWALACKYYTPHLRGKTLTPKMHPLIMQAFVDVFGEYAGWAHNTLFIGELASQQQHLPPGMRTARASTAPKSPKRSKSAAANSKSAAAKLADESDAVKRERPDASAGSEQPEGAVSTADAVENKVEIKLEEAAGDVAAAAACTAPPGGGKRLRRVDRAPIGKVLAHLGQSSGLDGTAAVLGPMQPSALMTGSFRVRKRL